jgi:hypothetical protein
MFAATALNAIVFLAKVTARLFNVFRGGPYVSYG